MPIYEYICLKCEERFSLLQSVHSSEKDTTCSRCGSAEVKKVMSAFCCSSGPGGSSGVRSTGMPAGG